MKYDFDLIIEDDNSLSKIIRQIKDDSVVLEFGPAAGRMTKFLKEHLHCKVYIVEIDDESAKKASQYAADTIVDDIENFKWLEKWENIKFDYIVFADVLEHLRNPQNVLTKTKMLLKDEGKTIISVPNVAHNSIMINLFNNVFNYTPVGLLDNTHIHLFAYNTLKEFCSFAGYVPVIEDAIYVNVGENEITALYNQVNEKVQKELKSRIYNNVYQFVFTLQKKSYVNMHSVELVKKILPYTNDYRFEVFFDKGNGWLEENSVSYFFRPQNRCKFVIPVSDNELIKQIRIDPIDCAYGTRLEEVLIYREDKVEAIILDEVNIETNAVNWENKEFLFVTEDPNIIVKNINWTGVLKIEISVSFIEKEQLAIQMLENKKCLNARLVQDKRLLNEELGRRAKELEHRMDVINQLNSEVTEYKLTIDSKNNEIKLANEELDRRAEELEHRMDVINNLKQKLIKK
ncbi:MAG TPA: hypothetical protein DCS73_05735 [Roseburia sp.]|nr:hypothetical protein [Roseburia sp.]